MRLPEIRREIESTDTRLARLREHRDKLKTLRAERLLRPRDDRRAQEVLRAVERGWFSSDGIPPEVAAIGSGLNMGLPATEAEIAGRLGTLLRRCGYSQEIDPALAGEVADARRSVEREETAA